MYDARKGAATTLWARDAAVYVSLHRPQDDRRSWLRYLDGLIETYTGWGVGHIVDRERLERDGCQHFWLLHDLAGRCVGGIRIEGPFTNAADYAGMAEMAGSRDFELLLTKIGEAAGRGLVEFKGAWSIRGRKGAGSVLGRCMQHSLWWLEAPHAFCISAAHAEAAWFLSGACRLQHIAASPYPNADYRSVVLFWGHDHARRIQPAQAILVEAERRYLASARERLNGTGSLGQWHPELLFDFDERLAELREAGVQFSDHLRICTDELDELLPPVSEDLLAEPAHWIYLPWRNMALHLPGPDSYWRLRIDRDRYKLLDDELRQLRTKTVGIVGLSVGAAAGFTVAQEALCGQLRLADHDVLELSNLNRLSAPVVYLGAPKTHITARRIAELDPYLPVTLYNDGLNEDNIDGFLAGLDVVVEECDSIDMKILLRRRAGSAGVPVIMETSDRGLLDVERFDLQPDRRPFHGLVGDLDPGQLANLTTDEKVPYILAILGADELSAPMAASMIEIDQTTRSWPQLASDVALGSCLITATVRRLFTNENELRSGRTRLDLDDVLDGLAEPAIGRTSLPAPAPIAHGPMPQQFPEALMAAATLAPSGGNMQPWRFELSESSFDVVIAPDSHVGMDIGLRGSAVACGAALANALSMAAAHSRLKSTNGALDLAIDLDRPDLAGRVLLGAASNESWADLAPMVPLRLSNRRYGPSTPLPAEQLDVLRQAADVAGGRLCYVPTNELGDLIDLWAEADRVRMLSPGLHREMMSELRRPGLDSLEQGIDERTLELSPSDVSKLAILRRPDVMAQLNRWDGGARLGDDTAKRFRASSGLVVMTVSGASRADYVRGGVALQRVWLTATRLGLWLQPMSPVFGYAQSQSELAEVIRSDRAERLYELSQRAYQQIGIQPEESFVLAARVLSGPPPTAISRRRETFPSVAPAPTGEATGQHRVTT